MLVGVASLIAACGERSSSPQAPVDVRVDGDAAGDGPPDDREDDETVGDGTVDGREDAGAPDGGAICRDDWSVTGDATTACDDCESGEVCAQLNDGLGEHFLTRCCTVESVSCLPDECSVECNHLLCVPEGFEPDFCVCGFGCEPGDPRAYCCGCP